jgi:uracil-DNA glycosylase
MDCAHNLFSDIDLEGLRTWRNILHEEFQTPYFKSILEFLKQEETAGKTIYPDKADIFQAFYLTPFEQVKAVILGQDPYHGPGQAHGLCFSVKPGVKRPPSLVNIFKELENDLQCPAPSHGCLASWARQGVLLLNAVLTVEAHKAGSHSTAGWQQLTDKVIIELSSRKDGIIFLLWGNHAQKKEQLIDSSKHLILKSAHPSPLSAHRGFFGCKHFSRVNSFLRQKGLAEIDWQIPADSVSL